MKNKSALRFTKQQFLIEKLLFKIILRWVGMFWWYHLFLHFIFVITDQLGIEKIEIWHCGTQSFFSGFFLYFFSFYCRHVWLYRKETHCGTTSTVMY